MSCSRSRVKKKANKQVTSPRSELDQGETQRETAGCLISFWPLLLGAVSFFFTTQNRYVLRSSRFVFSVPTARGHYFLSHRSPLHPFINPSNCGFGVLGFELSAHLHRPQPLPLGVWHCAVVISDFILFIVAPTAPSSFSDSLSDQSSYGSSSHNEPDSDNIDPDFPEAGH